MVRWRRNRGGGEQDGNMMRDLGKGEGGGWWMRVRRKEEKEIKVGNTGR